MSGKELQQIPTPRTSKTVILTPKQLQELTEMVAAKIANNIDHLPDTEERLEDMKKQITNNTNKVDTLQDTVDVFGQQIVDDRGEIVEIKESVAKLEKRGTETIKLLTNLGQQIIDGVKTNINKQEDRMIQKITDAVPSVVHMATQDVIEPKRGKFQRVASKGFWTKFWDKYFVRK